MELKASSKPKKLSTQIGIIMSVLLTVIFTIFIVATVIVSNNALEKAISSDFNNVSEKTAARVQGIFQTASNLAENLQYYMNGMYVVYEEQIKTNTVDKTLKKSDVTGTNILALNMEVEDYFTNTVKSAVSNNSDIMAAGAFFEPFAFDESVEHYALYVNVANVNEFVPYNYSEYGSADYYTVALKTQKPYFTKPYTDNGIMMVSACYPIISNGVSQGVIVVDINVSNFAPFAVDTSEYPTIFNEILTDESIIVFDSTDLSGQYVGMNTTDFISDSATLTDIKNGYSKKQPFEIKTKSSTGKAMERFYYPLTVGEQTWWSLTALDFDDMNKSSTITTLLMIIMAVIALTTVLIITIYTLHKKISPINQVVEAAEKIAAGDLRINLSISSQDEIGRLANTFTNMSTALSLIIKDVNYLLGEMANGNFVIETKCEENYVGDYKNILLAVENINSTLSDALKQIDGTSNQVSSGSEQVSHGAQALSQGATEQASAVEELAATIAEISEQSKNTSKNAIDANDRATSTEHEATNSSKRMSEMLTAMDNISSTSSEINKIIKTIEDIAFQTNILALNAAVEAARAGAAGKGFAVVADEVRNLASKSADASKNTSALIESSLVAVRSGTTIAQDTAKSLSKVVMGIQDVAGIVESISVASKEQSVAINQINMGIEQISSVVQTNSATAEESAAASEELSGQAQMLKDMVSRFQIKTYSK